MQKINIEDYNQITRMLSIAKGMHFLIYLIGTVFFAVGTFFLFPADVLFNMFLAAILFIISTFFLFMGEAM